MTEGNGEPPPGTPAAWPAKLRWRTLAVAAVAAATGTAAIVGLSRPAAETSRYAVSDGLEAAPPAELDPATAELIRCRSLPPQADDPGCRAAWESSRRRFFGGARAMGGPRDLPANPAPAPAPVDVAPATNAPAIPAAAPQGQ